METNYSILSVLIRPEIQEKISVGLLLFNNDDVYFSYSRHKVLAAKALLSNASFKILKDTLNNIEKKISSDNSNYSQKKGFKVFKNRVFENAFSAPYISYLSRYSNNVIAFSSPKEIYLELNNFNFISLFKKYVDNFTDIKDPVQKVKPFDLIKNQYGDRIKKHYNISLEVTPEKVPNLINSVRVDFTGTNEIDVYAQTIDTEASFQTVTSHINAFIQLKTTYLENRVRMHDFLIAKEPIKQKFPKQHDIWRQLRNSSILNYLDLSDSEEIIRYAETHGVVPSATEAE